LQTGVAARPSHCASAVHGKQASVPFESKRQSGFAGSEHPSSVVGLQTAQRSWFTQKGNPRSLTHSASSMQPRQRVVVASQIGVFGVAQSVAELAQPPQAPLVVHFRVPPQSSSCIEHGLHVFVSGSQIGVLPLQPALLRLGSH
jgi:hypothetical protein